MALSCEDLIDEVKDLIGRPADTKLITDARVTRWINEAQNFIVDNCPGLIDLQFKNTTSLDFSEDQISYAVGDITAGDTTDEGVAHVDAVYYLDGANSIKLEYMPFDEFDEELIDPTDSDHSSNKPTRWTRRGGNIEIAPRPSSAYATKDMRVDGVRYAAEFTTNDSSSSEISNADKVLINYAVKEAWGTIGGEQGHLEALKWTGKFLEAFTDFKDKNNLMLPWSGNIFFSDD